MKDGSRLSDAALQEKRSSAGHPSALLGGEIPALIFTGLKASSNTFRRTGEEKKKWLFDTETALNQVLCVCLGILLI